MKSKYFTRVALSSRGDAVSFTLHTPNGEGTMMCSNGDIYEGDYKDDRMNEKGKFKWANGAVYEGDYEDDKRTICGEGRQ